MGRHTTLGDFPEGHFYAALTQQRPAGSSIRRGRVSDVHGKAYSLRSTVYLGDRQQPIRHLSIAKIAFIGTDPRRRRGLFDPIQPHRFRPHEEEAGSPIAEPKNWGPLNCRRRSDGTILAVRRLGNLLLPLWLSPVQFLGDEISYLYRR